MLVIKRACPLNERLARERTARQICRKNQFPRSLLRIKFPRPIDNYAAEAAVQAIRILPERPQQAKKRLIRTVFVQRGCKSSRRPAAEAICSGESSFTRIPASACGSRRSSRALRPIRTNVSSCSMSVSERLQCGMCFL